MTDKLDPHSRRELIEYKFEKSRQALKEAEVLANAAFYNAAVNRLYYSAYYSASAMLLEASLKCAPKRALNEHLGN